MYHPTLGVINHALARAGLGPVDWLGDPRIALVALMIVSAWATFGAQMTVFLAGLAAIPRAYLDAAQVDGANAWQGFWRVTLPLLRPVTVFVLVTGIIGACQMFALVMVLTGGGPLGATDVVVSWLLGLIMVAPFLYMLTTALTGAEDSLDHTPLVGPSHLHPETFAAALAALPFGRLVLNSLIFSGAVVAGQVFTSTTAAYAFARLRFAGRDRLFLGYLSVLMLPAGVLLVPRFLLISALGWVDTYPGLVSSELVSVAGIFLLRQFFLTLPRDLEDAARLEGAGEWTIFRRIVLPQSRPALVTFAVLALAAQWRSF